MSDVADEGAVRAVAQPTPDWWRPTRVLATWLTWLLIAQAVLALLAPLVADQAPTYVKLHQAFDALLDDRDATADRLFEDAQDDDDAQALTTTFNFLRTAVLVLMIIWMWRSAHNARALGRTGERLSPGWAIGAWFVPLANLVLVYIVVSDLWRSSDPDASRGSGWRSLSGSTTVRAWWAAWVIAFLLSIGGPALAIFGVTDESQTRALLVGAGIVSALAALLNVLVVREITARQGALQDLAPAPTSAPVAARQFAAPTTVDGPGWYADPGRRFDHRYWDGSSWTEHVSVGGVASTAPVVAADWYPDPTGRFHWRYWTGHEWTEHVSRDKELFIDPID